MKRYIFIIAALTALIFTGCSNDDDRPVKTPHRSADRHLRSGDRQPGNRLQGIVVSDGYTCTATDENGVYQLTAGEFSYQVYLSIPAAYEVPMSEGLPCFWQKPTEAGATPEVCRTSSTSSAWPTPVPEHDQHRTFQQRNGTRHRRAGRSLDAAVLRHHVGRHRLEHREYGLHERRIPADEKRPCRWTRSGCRSSS